MRTHIIALLCVATLIASCGSKKKRPTFYDSGAETYVDSTEYQTNSDYSSQDDNIVSIPFREEGGVKYVAVSVNGFGFDMIFDTGCSGALISVAEANYLYQKGKLSSDDVLGVAKSQIADGSIVENMVVNLREVIVGGQIRCTNVQATVSANINAPLLLGNEVLDRASAYAVDNDNHTINFKLK